MAQKDYVNYGRKEAARKQTHSKKQRPSGISITTAGLLIVVAIFFTASLWFITHKKPWNDASFVPSSTPGTSNGLPPKPEERWRYIKELENRQSGIEEPVEPRADKKLTPPVELTDEQRRLLQQMQLDMRNQPTQLPAIAESVPSPHASALTEAPVINNQKKPVLPPASGITPPVSGKSSAPTTAVIQPARPDSLPEKNQHWVLQCGSFRTLEQAETIRAQLAFNGIESHITSHNGWNRVMLGPYSNRALVDRLLQQLSGLGITNCITSLSGA